MICPCPFVPISPESRTGFRAFHLPGKGLIEPFLSAYLPDSVVATGISLSDYSRQTPLFMPELIQPSHHTTPCIILIGMAGAGKSTLGKKLARKLVFGHVDTDHILEAWWGMDLQTLTESLSREHFLHTEARIIQSLDIKRAVISTGGSVIYNPDSMQHLKSLGSCVYLKAGVAVIKQRIARAPLRGLAITPGQSIEDLYREREPLYAAAADVTIPTDTQTVEACVASILEQLPASVTS